MEQLSNSSSVLLGSMFCLSCLRNDRKVHLLKANGTIEWQIKPRSFDTAAQQAIGSYGAQYVVVDTFWYGLAHASR